MVGWEFLGNLSPSSSKNSHFWYEFYKKYGKLGKQQKIQTTNRESAIRPIHKGQQDTQKKSTNKLKKRERNPRLKLE